MIAKGNVRERREVGMCVVVAERAVGTAVVTAKVTATVEIWGALVRPVNPRAHGRYRAWTILMA